MRTLPLAVVPALGLALVAGCSPPAETGAVQAGSSASSRPSSSPSAPPSASPSASPSGSPERTRPPSLASDGRHRPAVVDIPAIGVRDLRVVPYRGTPDDAAGTEIQNGGLAASPHGPGGGTGAGGIGNYIVTAHRLSSTQAFLRLPELTVGERVHVVAGGTRYTYKVVRTRQTSFRSERSLAEQSAPVPGRPGVRPTRAMITLSTCATPEDHAAGNFWSDEYGNPEHRIDKIGVLISATRAGG